MPNAAVIIGASGRIGGALAEQVAGSGRYSVVHAISRTASADRGSIWFHIADIADEASVERVAGTIGTEEPVGLVIVASGLLHDTNIRPEKALKSIDPVAMARLFAVNTIGPAIVAKHFVPLLPRRGDRSSPSCPPA